METIASKPLGPVWKDRLGLSTRVPPEFYERSDDVGNVPHAGALRTTLDDLRGSAVFCVQHVPTVVVLAVDEYDPAAVAPLRAALWNQGLASLLVVVSGDTVRVLSLPRAGVEDDVDRWLVDKLDAVTQALEIRNLVYAAESGRYWEEHPDHFRPEERVDRVLLNNLTRSHQLLLDTDLSPDAAQALLVQTMFVAYLEDREIVGAEYFQGVSNALPGDFETLLGSGDVESLERLFEALRQDFNGDLFIAPCSFDAHDRGPRLRASHLEILARFRSGREEMHGPGGQYRFWGYNFRYVPVELVSAVHDRFLGERPDRRTSGAYYTPMFLADTVISHAWDRLPPAIQDGGRFLDPACGSGIFLVRLFQRLCEHRRAAGSEPTISWDDLLEVLSRLQGRDLDRGAVRMAVFSLYVALLEEVDPPDIRALMDRGKILPRLYGSTLRAEDFFAADPDDAPADAIVGNPPWSSRRGEGHSPLEWCADEGLPKPGQEQAWPFVWKSLRHLQENGVAAFLLPAMGFLHNQDAIDARKRLLSEAQVFSVVNFADLRFQLFDGAVRPAALLLFGRPPAGGAAYRFDYLTPKADLNLKSRRLITIGAADRCRLDSRMVEEDPSVFKKRLWLSEPEARLFNYLAQFRRLDDLVAEFGTLSRRKEPTQGRWVVGQGFQPYNAERSQGAAREGKHSNVVAAIPHLPIGKFRVPVLTCEGLQPWKDGRVRRGGFDTGFQGSRVLVPRGVVAGASRGGPRLRAAFVEDPLTFRHIVQAIAVPPGDECRGMLLAGLLNSRLMLWFAFHGTSSFGADRPEVQQAELLRLPFPAPDDMPDPEQSRVAADGLAALVEKQLRPPDPAFDRTVERRLEEHELLEEIDGLAYNFFCLSEEEKILVEDTVKHVIPAVQPNQGSFPAIWRSSTPGDRREYARTLVGSLADWLEGDCSIGTRLVARNDDLAILRLSLRDGPGAFDYAEDDDQHVAAALSRLAEHVHQPLPGNFQTLPDFRVFVDRDLFLVKPSGKRFWLRSAALADAGAIVLDLHEATGGRDAGGWNRA